jgi:glycosyltransferase involved in cell wall biosynthesis
MRPTAAAPLRVALAVSSTVHGGAEKYLLDLYDGLVQNYPVTVDLVGALPSWPSDVGRNLVVGRGVQKLTSHAPRLKQALAAARLAAAQARIIKRGGYDLVHMQYKREQIFLTPLAVRHTPVLWTEHGRLPSTMPAPLRLAYFRLAKRVKVIAIADHIERDFAAHDVKAAVIRSPINPAPERVGGRDSANRQQPPKFLYAGRLHENKRVDLLLAAAALMPDASFSIAGDGPDRARLKALAGPNVEFLGYREDLTAIYAEADAVVLTSGRTGNEGSPLTMLEALSAGKPVVLTHDSDAASEAQTLGCILCEPEPESLAAALRDALSKPSPTGEYPGRTRAEWLAAYFDAMSKHGQLAGKRNWSE